MDCLVEEEVCDEVTDLYSSLIVVYWVTIYDRSQTLSHSGLILLLQDHIVEDCPQLIAKWKANNVPPPQNQNQNENQNMNQAVNQPQNHNEGPFVGKFLVEPRSQPIDVRIITWEGATMGDDSTIRSS